jgi:general stress protein 26
VSGPSAGEASAGEPIELGSDVHALLTEKQRIGKLGTTRKNGRSWIQPLWFNVEGDEITVVVIRDTITARCLRRTAQATLCVDDDRVPYRFVVLECSAEVDESESRIRPSLRAMIARYRPDIDADGEVDAYLQTPLLHATLRVERMFYMPQVVDVQGDQAP